MMGMSDREGYIFFTAYVFGVGETVRSEEFSLREFNALPYCEKYRIKEELKQKLRDKLKDKLEVVINE